MATSTSTSDSQTAKATEAAIATRRAASQLLRAAEDALVAAGATVEWPTWNRPRGRPLSRKDRRAS